MRESMPVLDQGPPFVEGEAAGLARSVDPHFQARCDHCLRTSPMITGNVHDMLARILDLGWRTTDHRVWTCPLCHDVGSGRHRSCR